MPSERSPGLANTLPPSESFGMRLNTRGRYGIQLMAQLACHTTQPDPVGLKDVAGATGLPWRYLEQIARPLRKAALVKGRPGRTGGYVLARQPDRISLRDVIEATSGPICLMDCVDDADSCEHSAACTSRNVWLAVTADIREVLSRYTLCDLAKRPCAGCREAADAARANRTWLRPGGSGRPQPARQRAGSRKGSSAEPASGRAEPGRARPQGGGAPARTRRAQAARAASLMFAGQPADYQAGMFQARCRVMFTRTATGPWEDRRDRRNPSRWPAGAHQCRPHREHRTDTRHHRLVQQRPQADRARHARRTSSSASSSTGGSLLAGQMPTGTWLPRSEPPGVGGA